MLVALYLLWIDDTEIVGATSCARTNDDYIWNESYQLVRMGR